MEITHEDAILTDCVQGVLTRLGLDSWQVRPDGFWCRVSPPPPTNSRVQGWKLHLSATPLSAPLVLARSAEVLARYECPYKFARTLSEVRELGSKQFERSGGGKFITVYPDLDEEQLRALAEDLHQATIGLPGPVILSDRPLRPGSLLHYRFGAFAGVRALGNDGCYEAMLIAPNGDRVLDLRTPQFAPPTWAPRDPFADERPAPPAGPAPVLLNGRYVVRSVVRHAFIGGVYRATDERTGVQVIIKQARAYTGANLTGRDIRDTRRYEARMLTDLSPGGRTPQLIDLFEQQGEVFLVQEQISGVTLREWVAANTAFDADGHGWGPPIASVRRIALGLVELMGAMHADGLVLRDFNPSNVMVLPDEQVRLIDVETLARPNDQVVRVYTLGYSAPEQIISPEIGVPLALSADLFGLGATLFHLATGVDPVLPPDTPGIRTVCDRIRYWLDQMGVDNPAARRFSEIIVALMHENPARRPTLDEVRDRMPSTDSAESSPARTSTLDIDRWIDDSIEHLILTMDPHSSDRLWPPSDFGATSDPLNVQYGAAGVLAALTAAYQHIGQKAGLREAVGAGADWISRHLPREPRTLPGLYFGRSGTAWALLEAGLALGDGQLMRTACELAGRVPVRWPNPDICHGMAGAGLTQLRFWEATGNPEFLERARQAADGVAAAVERGANGPRWPIPRNFASALAGTVHYGFAHGVAGNSAFLLAASRATGDSGYLDLAIDAAESLLDLAEIEHGAAYWARGEASSHVRLTHWCSGSSGVATFLLRMIKQTGDERYRDLVGMAGLAIHRRRWTAGPAQCHGLSGDGEFLLDLAEVEANELYREWATDLAGAISVRNAVVDGRMIAPNETGTTVVADYGTGLAGVLAFLTRLRYGGPRLWQPASLTEVN